MPTPDPLSQFRLDGRVAIVTGAGCGPGERFARVLAALGAKVVVTAGGPTGWRPSPASCPTRSWCQSI